MKQVGAAPIVQPNPTPSASSASEEQRLELRDEPQQRTEETEHTRSIVWNLREDLRLLVGSDLAIFGAPDHPCISLKLHANNQPISVFTGIDCWLENLVNEVSEVAMCFHSDGVVQHDFRVISTDDLSRKTGFDTEEVKRYVANVMEFLRRRQLREGRTYWLHKSDDNDVAKLYDLSDLLETFSPGEQKNASSEPTHQSLFTRPVAILCCTLAESRVKRLTLWDDDSQHHDVLALKESFEEVAEDALRLLRGCFRRLPPQHDLRLFVRAVQISLRLVRLVRGRGLPEPVLGSAVAPPAAQERSSETAAACVEVPIPSLRDASPDGQQRRKPCSRQAEEPPPKDFLSQLTEAMSLVLDQRKCAKSSAEQAQEDAEARWEAAALKSLREAALRVALQTARDYLDVPEEDEGALEAGQNALQWERMAEFLLDSADDEQLSAAVVDLHVHSVSYAMHCANRVDGEEARLAALTPSGISETQRTLVHHCLTAASPDKKCVSRALVATAEMRITDSIVSIFRLHEATVQMRTALEAQKGSSRTKGCMGPCGLANGFVQTLTLYMRHVASHLIHKSQEHFQRKEFDVSSYVAMAISLARKWDLRIEGAICYLAHGTLYKMAAFTEVGSTSPKLEAALKTFNKARDALPSKHTYNSINIMSEINRCRLRAVLEIIEFRKDLSDTTKKELLESVLDAKCWEDWGNPEFPTFKCQVRSKFQAQSLLISLFHKYVALIRPAPGDRARYLKLSCTKACKMVNDLTVLQRQYFTWVFSCDALVNNLACADMAAEAFISVLITMEKLFDDVEPYIHSYSSSVNLLVEFLSRFHRQDPVLQLHRFEQFGSSGEWRTAAASLCSFVQHAICSAARNKKPAAGTKKGAANTEGATKNGTSEEGAAITEGATKNGTSEEGAAITEGATKNGNTEEGAANTEGATKNGNTEEGAVITEGATKNGTSEEGAAAAEGASRKKSAAKKKKKNKKKGSACKEGTNENAAEKESIKNGAVAAKEDKETELEKGAARKEGAISKENVVKKEGTQNDAAAKENATKNGAVTQLDKGAVKNEGDFEKNAATKKGAITKEKVPDKGAERQEKDLCEKLKQVYRELLQLQLRSTNSVLCVRDMCDQLLLHFEGISFRGTKLIS